MRKALPLLAACLLLPAALRAHRPEVYMTRVSLKADGDVLRARVEVTALAWMMEVTGPVAPGPWPPEKLALSLAHIHETLPFAVDGRSLEGRILGARVLREPWDTEKSETAVLDLLYPLPSTGSVLTVRGSIFLENWEENEGARPESASLPGHRDFRTRFRWSCRPGGVRTVTVQAPEFSISLKELRRPAWESLAESAGLGLSVFVGLGGLAALVLSAALFPPAAPAARAGLAAAVVAGGLGAALPVPVGEWILWAAVALLGVASVSALRTPWWIAGLVLGAAAAGRSAVLQVSALQAATAFARLSLAACAAGFLAPVAAVFPARRLTAFLHRRSFGYLTPQEYERQALFHRQIIARLLALAGLYWVLSPLWEAAR